MQNPDEPIHTAEISPRNWLIIIILAILAGWLIVTGTSCTTVKRSSTAITAVHDTLRVQVHDTTAQVIAVEDSIYVHDTVITSPGYTVTDTFTPAELQPATLAGHKISHSYNHTTGNEHSTLTVDTAGRIIVTCHEDSLRTIIANLVTQLKTTRDSIHIAMHDRKDASNNTSTATTTVITKTKTFFDKFKWWIIGIMIAVIIGTEIFQNEKNKLL